MIAIYHRCVLPTDAEIRAARFELSVMEAKSPRHASPWPLLSALGFTRSAMYEHVAWIDTEDEQLAWEIMNAEDPRQRAEYLLVKMYVVAGLPEYEGSVPGCSDWFAYPSLWEAEQFEIAEENDAEFRPTQEWDVMNVFINQGGSFGAVHDHYAVVGAGEMVDPFGYPTRYGKNLMAPGETHEIDPAVRRVAAADTIGLEKPRVPSECVDPTYRANGVLCCSDCKKAWVLLWELKPGSYCKYCFDEQPRRRGAPVESIIRQALGLMY